MILNIRLDYEYRPMTNKITVPVLFGKKEELYIITISEYE